MRKSSLARKVAIGAIALVLSSAVVACSGGGSSPSGDAKTLRVALAGDVGSLDPAVWRGAEPAYIEYQMYEGLMKLDPESRKPVPSLAETVDQVSPTEYVFKLHDGVKFWDGSAMDADDVVYSYERAINKEVGAWNAAEYSTVEKYTATDPLTVTVELKQPDNLFLPHLTGTMGVVVSKEWGEANGDTALATKPMGTGAYKFVSQSGSEVVLERNADYWGSPTPKIERIEFKIIKDATSTIAALRSGEIDLTFSLPVDQLQVISKMDDLKIETSPSTLLHQFMVHQDTKPLGDIHVRKAISYALDNAAALQQYPKKYLEPVTGSPISPIKLYGGMTPTRKSLEGTQGTGDMAAAKAEMAKSIAPDGFEVDLTYQSDIQVYDTYALYAQQQLKELGITVNLSKLAPGEYLSRAYGGKLKGLEISGWYNTFPNAGGVLLPLASKDAIGSTNRNFYSSPEFEKAAKTLVNGDPALGDEATAEMEKLVVEDAAFFSVAFAANVQVSSTRVDGPALSEILIWQPWAKEMSLR